MKIYAAEKDIADKLKNKSIAYSAAISKYDGEIPDFKYLTQNQKLTDVDNIVLASIKDKELYYHTSILVTTTWNKNDDIFTPATVWAARNTPVHKPTNLNHDAIQIVGHMTNSWAIDESGNILEESDDVKELPDKFHILVGSVIYKLWDGHEEYEEKVEALLKEIDAGTKYVSMECTFADFDYGLISDNEPIKIIARNEETAFFTKHLRAYGGDGTYNNYKIGRVVKSISFCGKGYVDKPANPESVIFTEDDIYDFAQAQIINKFDEKTLISKSGGVLSSNDLIISQEQAIMSEFYETQNKELKAKNEVLETKISELQDQFAKSNVAKLEKEIESLKAHTNDLGGDLTSKAEALEAKATEVKTLQAKVDELLKASETLVNTNKELSDKVQAVEAEKKTQARVSTLVEGGLSKEDAAKEVETFANLNDDQFAAIANRIVEAAKFMSDEEKKKMEDVKKSKDKTNCSSQVDETTVETAEITDTEVASAGAEAEDEVMASLVKNLTAALKTDKENGDK